MPYIISEKDKLLIGGYLETIAKYSGNNIPKLHLEKLLVLLFRIGQKNDLFFQFPTTQIMNNIDSKNIGIDYYLHGPIVKVNEGNFIDGFNEQWLSQYLKENQIIIENRLNKGYNLSSNIPAISDDRTFLVKSIGALLGELIFKRKILSANDLVVLTTCDTPNNINQALFAECSIFQKYWDSKKEIKANSVSYQAINSGWWKIRSFFNNEVNNIINRISNELEDDIYRNIWESFWEKSVVDLDVINKNTLHNIITRSSLLFALNIYSRIYLFNEKDSYKKNSKGKLLKDILNIKNEFLMFFQEWLKFPLIANIMEDVEFLINKVQNDAVINHQLIYSFIDGIVELFEKAATDDVPKDIYFKEAKNSEQKSKKREPKIKKEINVLIASPGDLHEEREYLFQYLERKFRLASYEKLTQKRLIVNGWEDLSPQLGYPQDIINEEIFERIDIIIAIFKYKLGSPTINKNGEIRALSGTVEELLHTLSERPDAPYGMAYFFNKAPLISLDSENYKTVEEQWNKLKEFKNDVRMRLLYGEYEDKNDLLESILVDIKNNIEKYFN